MPGRAAAAPTAPGCGRHLRDGAGPGSSRRPWPSPGPAWTFGAPLALTGTSDSCTAFETALLQRSTRSVAWAEQQSRWPMPLATAERRSRSGGSAGRRIAAMEHGWLPAPAGCTALYWQVRMSRLVS
jgi:hypothetical protein